MGHRHFFREISQNREFIQNFAMTEEILFISHVANGIHIIIHNVIWYSYNTNSYNCMYTLV